MAYDVASGEVVLFGGFTSSGFSNETWTFDGTDWTNRRPPTARGSLGARWPTTRGREVVLFGGPRRSQINEPGFDGSDCTTAPAHSRPAKRPQWRTTRGAEKSSFSAARRLFQRNWILTGTDWIQRTPAHSPPRRNSAAMAYDAGERRARLSAEKATDSLERNLDLSTAPTGRSGRPPTPVGPRAAPDGLRRGARSRPFRREDGSNSSVKPGPSTAPTGRADARPQPNGAQPRLYGLRRGERKKSFSSAAPTKTANPTKPGPMRRAKKLKQTITFIVPPA